MALPKTPTRSKEDLDNLIDNLNTRWNLHLPVRTLESPSKSTVSAEGSQPLPIRCQKRMKRLYYHPKGDLETLIAGFEEFARPKLSNWLWKPQQEPGTLPSRPIEHSFILRDAIARTRDMTDTQRDDLLQELLRLLKNELYLRGCDDIEDQRLSRPNTAERTSLPPVRSGQSQARPHSTNGTTTAGASLNGLLRSQQNSKNAERSSTDIAQFQRPSVESNIKRKLPDAQEVYFSVPSSLLADTEFEALHVEPLDPLLLNPTDASAGQNFSPSKKRQSIIADYYTTSKSSAMPIDPAKQTQTLPDMTTSFESTESTTGPPTFSSMERSFQTNTSFTSFRVDPSEEMTDVDDSTQDSSIADVWKDETFATIYNAACNVDTTVPTFPSVQGFQVNGPMLAQLAESGPFRRPSERDLCSLPLRYRYELQRIAAAWQLRLADLNGTENMTFNTYGEFWNHIRSHKQREQKTLPERSSAKAWDLAIGQFQGEDAHNAVILSGQLEWSSQLEPGLLRLRLNSLRLERSCRFYRRFGSDRFLTLALPSLAKGYLPSYLQPEALTLQQTIAIWLATAEHHYLGRTWRAFFIEDDKGRRSRKASDGPRCKIHLFAVDGVDFLPPSVSPVAGPGQTSDLHAPMSVASLLDWHIPLQSNITSGDCKAFQRFSLGLSRTMPTAILEPCEFVQLEDQPGKSVMNDGCARMSESLAMYICERLGIATRPSVFQGRIAGAKGVWMVEKDDRLPKLGQRGFCIEVSDSQLKIKPHPKELVSADGDKLTFEVVTWSSHPKPASLNSQLLAILQDRGFPGRTWSVSC